VPANAALIPDPPTPAASPFGIPGEMVPTLEENFLAESGTPLPANPPLTEREQEIAAARAAHSSQGIQTVKPRLSFILSGGEAPAPEENEAALNPTEQKDSEQLTPDAKALKE
jgi:hypothetical protein